MARMISTIRFFLLLFIIGFGHFSYAKDKKPMNLEDATNFVQKNSQGKVLSAKTLRRNGINTHRIKVITPSGRVKVYKVPSNKQVKPSNNRNNQNRTRARNQNLNRVRQSHLKPANVPHATPSTTTQPKGAVKRK